MVKIFFLTSALDGVSCELLALGDSTPGKETQVKTEQETQAVLVAYRKEKCYLVSRMEPRFFLSSAHSKVTQPTEPAF